MFSIREIEQSDSDAFVALLSEQFQREEPCKQTSNFKERFLKCFNPNGSTTILIATEQNRIKGYVVIHWLRELWADGPEALISSLYVALNERNAGVGSALLEAVIQKIKQNNCQRLWLENNRNNPIYSKQFYKNRGWVERLDVTVFEYKL